MLSSQLWKKIFIWEQQHLKKTTILPIESISNLWWTRSWSNWHRRIFPSSFLKQLHITRSYKCRCAGLFALHLEQISTVRMNSILWLHRRGNPENRHTVSAITGQGSAGGHQKLPSCTSMDFFCQTQFRSCPWRRLPCKEAIAIDVFDKRC